MKGCPSTHCRGSVGVIKTRPDRLRWWIYCPTCGACGPFATDLHAATVLWDELPRVPVAVGGTKKTLSETQERVYGFVRTRILEGRPPTYEDIKLHFGWASVQAVASALNGLVSKGWLHREKYTSRSLQIVRLKEAG